jgi:DNA-directed RNA polymerase subunit M/transcription elongation factor TFIIS
MFRNQGKAALSTVLNIEKNVNIIEDLVFSISNSQTSEIDELEEIYKENIYQVVGDILKTDIQMKNIAKNIKQGKVGWNHRSYNKIRILQDEQDDYLICPFDVEEGVNECGKCGSKRVISFDKQTRSCDEGTSVYCTCIKPGCGNRWVMSG